MCAGVCPAPRQAAQAPGACLQPGAWDILAAASHMPLLNSAIHNEFTHSVQYPRYSADQCNPQ